MAPYILWDRTSTIQRGVLGYLKRVVFEFNLVFYLCFTSKVFKKIFLMLLVSTLRRLKQNLLGVSSI